MEYSAIDLYKKKVSTVTEIRDLERRDLDDDGSGG